MYDNPPILNKEDIFNDIKNSFTLFDFIQWFQFVGGELFLHPDMGDILRETWKYEKQFEKLILMTNGTIVPRQDVLEALTLYGKRCDVQISDYGSLSWKREELEQKLKEYGIPFTTKAYHGDMQHYGGWVDNSSMQYRNYSKEEKKYLFEHCWQIGMSNWHVYQGKLHNCIRSLFASDLGVITPDKNEYIDYNDNRLSLEKKREIARNFNKKPLMACDYCNGFNAKESARYPAAEQI